MIVSVILGCLTTVGVSWAIALTQAEDATAAYGNTLTKGEARQWWRRIAPPEWPETRFKGYENSGAGWHVITINRIDDVGPLQQASEYRFGWPAAAFAWLYLDPAYRDVDAQLRYIYTLPRKPALDEITWSPEGPVVPLLPVWPGLILNTLVYSACWYVLMSFLYAWFRSAHRVLMRRNIAQGLCPQCGYNLKGGDSERCSECGWNR